MKTLYKDTTKKNINNIGVMLLYIGLIEISAISCILMIIMDTPPSEYKLLPFLPLTFGLCSCIFVHVYKYLFKRVSVTLIIGTYFFRSIIIPAFMCLGDYTSLIQNYNVYRYMSQSIILLMYEIILVFIVLITSLKDLRASIEYNKFNSIVIFNTKSCIFKLILFIMIGFEVICFVVFPELSSYDHFFIATSLQEKIMKANEYLYMRQVVPSVIYRLYAFVFGLLQLIIPILFIQTINKKYGIRKQRKAITLSLIIILFAVALMTPEKATSIFIGINLFILIYYLYPSKMKKLIPYAALSIVILIFGGLVLKSGISESDNFFNSLSSVLVSYFSGPPNVAVAISMKSSFNIGVILSDIINSIPFMGYFFKNLVTTPEIFNNSLYMNEGRTDQIIPMIGQGYFYFGFAFAPIFSCLCIKMTIKFEKYARDNRDILKKYVYMYGSLLFAVSPVMYNLNILISIISNFMVILFITRLSGTKNLDT